MQTANEPAANMSEWMWMRVYRHSNRFLAGDISRGAFSAHPQTGLVCTLLTVVRSCSSIGRSTHTAATGLYPPPL